MSIDNNGEWHLDKKVPISIILTLLLQFGIGLWFVGKLEARVESLEAHKAEQSARDGRQDAAVVAATATMNSRLDRIDSKLDRLIERSAK